MIDPRVDLFAAVTNVQVTFKNGEFGIKAFEFAITHHTNQSRSFPIIFRLSDASGQTISEQHYLVQNDSGALDPGFAFQVDGGTNAVRDMALAPDGSVLVVGNFDSVNGHSVTNVARLLPDLTLDTNFALSLPPNNTVSTIAIRPSGEILLSGLFSKVGATPVLYVAQFFADGTFDEPFTSSNRVSRGIDRQPVQLLPREDGSLLALMPNYLRLIKTNGVHDRSYIARYTRGVPLQLGSSTDGSLIGIGGAAITRLDAATGITETNFNLSVVLGTKFGFSTGLLNSISIQPDGGVLVGGAFTMVDGFSSSRIARLLPNGTVDRDFSTTVGASGAASTATNTVTAIQTLADGDILVGGDFPTVDGQAQPRLARLSPTGEWRSNFRPQLAGNRVEKFLPLPSGDILVRGSITEVDGVEVGSLFRIQAPQLLPPVVSILTPTNGIVYTSDAVAPSNIAVTAYDPDGFLAETTLYLDGQALATNRTTFFSFSASIPYGEHNLTAIATDSDGLATTNQVTFTLQTIPLPTPLRISLAGSDLTITFVGQLQSSQDLITWSDVTATSPYTEPVSKARTFFRSR